MSILTRIPQRVGNLVDHKFNGLEMFGKRCGFGIHSIPVKPAGASTTHSLNGMASPFELGFLGAASAPAERLWPEAMSDFQVPRVSISYMAICQGQITAMIWAFFALKNCEEFEKKLDKAQELSGSFAVQFEGRIMETTRDRITRHRRFFLVGVHESGGDISVCFNNGIIETVCFFNDFGIWSKIVSDSHVTSRQKKVV